MGYDYHWSGSHAGPLAPLGWIQAVAHHAAATGAGDRFILALGNYAYTPTSYCSLADCAALCTASDVVTTTEMQSCIFNVDDHFGAGRAPNCTVAGGTMFFDDTASLEEKVQAAADAGLGGVGHWTIGKEPDGFAAMVKKYY
jgi:spore germination protein YaaH